MKTEQQPISDIRFAWKYLKTERTSFIIALVFVIISAGMQLLTPISIEFLINNAIAQVNYTLLWQVILGMSILFLIQAVIFRFQVVLVGKAAQRIMYCIRTELFGHIQHLGTSFFGSNKSGDLISRINSDTTLLDNFLGQYIFSFTSSFFVFIAFGMYLLILNPLLALVSFGVIGITVIISYSIRGRIARANSDGLVSNGEIKGYLADNLNNYQVIQSYNIAPQLENEFECYNHENQVKNRLSRIMTNLFAPLYNLTGNLAIVLILLVVVHQSAGNEVVSIGALVAFVYATVQFFQPLRELGTVFSSLAEALAAMTRIRQILNEKPHEVFADENIIGEFETDTAITFDSISFSYPNNDKPIFENISFSVPTNSKFAIVGPTGEGKSTIAKLMSGLAEPTHGTITVFGQPLKNWSQGEFYNSLGFILQDPFMFSGSVARNIIYGNPAYEVLNQKIITLTGAEREAAHAELVAQLEADIVSNQLDSIIPEVTQFLETEVSNNSQNISQGQKQIINFMRVLLRRPRILILDEATANLDTVTERYLQEALDRLNSKVTQIVIAHRLSTIKDADYIMSVGGGEVNVEKK